MSREPASSISLLKSKIQKSPVPVHIGVIMDGNGRWAKKRGLSRNDGHRKGAEVIDSLLKTASDLGVRVISLYAFSTENWKRPSTEITALFSLLDEFILSKLEKMKSNSIRLKVSGDIKKIPKKSRQLVENAIKETADNKKIILNFCINYGSMDELARAVTLLIQRRVEKISAKKNQWDNSAVKNLQKKVDYTEIRSALDTHDIPDVDLLIRTSGEMRLSNFMLLQSAYAELYFTDTLWPDFSDIHLMQAIEEFQKRNRKFGGIDE